MTHAKNKTMRTAYNRFLQSKLYDLHQCYARPSDAKYRAFNYCLELVNKYNDGFAVRDYAVIGYNIMTFSFGFIGEIDGKQAFFYITRDYDRYILIDEI